ncbi:hypothetical protein BV898_02081 [Hypsibius exemplaris]|uniref:Receptor ligand binding region domain-containing protein n=1 Tax=Hypsibius exemplaris TaxID=2072580 RepID=A0A1W0X9Q6_HYPEX|nr:hypothetical protein BV898_02081 [Hypsibius exemplaris]
MSTEIKGGLPSCGPAFETALEEVKHDYPSLNLSQTFVIDNSSPIEVDCTRLALPSDSQVAEYFYTKRRQRPIEGRNCWTLFILSGCGNSLPGIQQFGNGLNKVVLSSGISSEYLTDKSQFPTLLTTAVSPFFMSYNNAFLKLAQLYNWTTVTVLTERGGPNSNGGFESQGRAIFDVLSKASPRIQTYFMLVSLTGPVTEDVLNAILDQFTASSRTTIACGIILRISRDSCQSDELRRQQPPVDFNDGAFLAKQFIGRTFQTKIGNVSFDKLGQRIPQILVGYYDNDDDKFVVCLQIAP